MAYLRELAEKCVNQCGRRAVVELYSRQNYSRGKFCRPCGRLALRDQARRESAADHPPGFDAAQEAQG
jgi:hypothetical protein